jgi:hypothetical protein
MAGLEYRCTVGELLHEHCALAGTLALEIIEIQEHLVGHKLPTAQLVQSFEQAVLIDPEHPCAGRTAKARLARTLEHAGAHGIAAPTLRRIAARPA